jgi:rare lipoprotein A
MALKRALAFLIIFLSGCASVPPPPDEIVSPVKSDPAPPPRTPGGYYKDDGPGDKPPPELASVPDAQPRREPLHRFANRPYEVFGQSYTPLAALQPFKQRGRASWYGRRFHGQRTSSGERYDMYGMTAAHPTLPIPSYARVTSLENGRSVVVRINDRGPFHAGRVIDLSYTAAYKLGFVSSGSAEVELESVLPSESGVYVQVGAFSSKENAESFRARLAQQLTWLQDAVQVLPVDRLYRLHVGPYASAEQARPVAERIEAELSVRPLLVVR